MGVGGARSENAPRLKSARTIKGLNLVWHQCPAVKTKKVNRPVHNFDMCRTIASLRNSSSLQARLSVADSNSYRKVPADLRARTLAIVPPEFAPSSHNH
ncbi:hypothetical protein PoB_006615800 [Plakobranchus ocellatus]|uniref:Uncharacterized protein n=1 Tax=Plakobranchus ocellatus TaxID=259542 RepID=A0AAV4D6G5_9GAST|nr:hypothetical protein PoB_006615800 [Plakobranchus ocellatus]